GRFSVSCTGLLSLFFFSSRRRHTRSKRDWSSDVCSSDLADDDEHVVFAPAGLGVVECGAGVGSGEVEGMETPGLEFGEDLRPAGLTAPMPGGGVDENAEAMRAHPHFSVDSPASSASIFARRLAIRRSASRLTPTARR